MAKWDCYAVVTAGKYLGTVEADTKKEAIEKASALDSACVSLCHQCSRECEDPEITRINVEKAD